MFEINSAAFDAGVERVDGKLTRVGQVAADMNPLWPKVGEVFAEHQREVFLSGYDWAPLARTTVLKKGSSMPLIETGRLMAAATSPVPVESNAHYAKFGLTHAQVPYAHWHARGAGVPRRDPVPKLSSGAIATLLDIVKDRIQQEWSA